MVQSSPTTAVSPITTPVQQTGRLDNALGQLVYFYARDAREAIERLQASIEPALTVAMGLLMLWIALAVLGPVYDITIRLPV